MIKKEIPNFGLCCMFYEETINFKTYTWKSIENLLISNQIFKAQEKICNVWYHNIETTQKSLDYCLENNILSYRISSDIFPHFHKAKEIIGNIGSFVSKLQKINSHNIKLSLHPGQYVNMGSIHDDVLQNSLKDLQYHFFLAENLEIKEINIHLGGIYGDKKRTKRSFCSNILANLSENQRNKLTFENDELNYNILDTLEICSILNVRCTFDIHHHRCYSLKESTIEEEEAFRLSRANWHDNYQRVHLSSPREGYISPMKSRAHSLFINEEDFPQWLLNYKNIHIDIEAKAKEKAIFRLREYLSHKISE